MFPSARKPPADIIIAITLSGFLAEIHFLMAGIYLAQTNELPDDQSAICQVEENNIN
jgi:hypothetical protein